MIPTLEVKGNKDIGREFGEYIRQFPWVYASACNTLAFMVRDAEMATVSEVFDRPKPQTVKNFWVTKGNKSRPGAMIHFDQIYNKGFDEYMIPEVKGGPRKMKRSESLIGSYYIPAYKVNQTIMDRYGNVKGTVMVQVLSRLGRIKEPGPGQEPGMGWVMNQTATSLARRGKGKASRKKSAEYFILSQPHGKLLPGIYQRTQSGPGFGAATSKHLPAGSFQRGRTKGKFSSVIRGKGLIPVVLFTTKQPEYKPRFPFFSVAQQVTDQNYFRVFKAAIDTAITGIRR